VVLVIGFTDLGRRRQVPPRAMRSARLGLGVVVGSLIGGAIGYWVLPDLWVSIWPGVGIGRFIILVTVGINLGVAAGLWQLVRAVGVAAGEVGVPESPGDDE
jgi:hypothetical protein